MWLGTITLFLTLILYCSTEKTVDLSQRGLKKEDFFLKIQSQIKLHEVTDLILRGNEFDSFLDCSTNLENLRSLDLSQNHLQRFFFLCKDEYNLQTLNVSHNKLEYIDDNALNDRIPKLKVLDLSSNRLSIVNETMLEHLKILEFLSLANNPINDGIHENAFWSLQALVHLDLKNVSAPFFSPEFFKTLTNLSTLNLSWNPIRTVPLLPTNLEELDISGTYVTQLRGIFLPKLRELRLNYMPNLRILPFNDLENLTSLETLSVIGSKRLNHLKVYPHNGPLLPRLQRLSITDCAFQTLGSDLRPIVQRTAVLNLENNPWKCDCKMEWVITMNSSNGISRDIKCRSPDQHFDKPLNEIPIEELECEYVATAFYPVLWACISILIIGIVVALGYVLLKQPLSHWDIRRRNRETVTYMNVVESSNDLVRILHVGETVERTEG